MMGFPKYIRTGQTSNRRKENFIYSNIQSNIKTNPLKQWSEKGNILATLLYNTEIYMTLQQAECSLTAVNVDMITHCSTESYQHFRAD
jgi:hypothetical protein